MINGKFGRAVFIVPFLWGLQATTYASCDHSINLHPSKKITLDGRSSYVSQNPYVDPTTFLPGDIVCINSIADAKMLRIYNLEGSSNNPIVFKNQNGQVKFSKAVSGSNVLVKNSRYLKFEGSIGGGEYGFLVAPSSGRSDKGIRLDTRTTDVEITGFEIENTKIGISISTKSNCSDGLLAETGSGTEMYDYDNDNQEYGDKDDITTANNFTMENYSIHHNHIHDIRDEGMYIGTNRSFPIYGPNGEQGDANGGETICQNGIGLTTMDPDYYVYNDPQNPKLRNLAIFSNLVERTKKEGINVKSVVENCAIYDNIVREDTLNNQQWQRGGINLQFPVRCDVYRNIIIDGHGPGIFASGVGGEIANNLIVRAGQEGSIEARGIYLRSPSYVEGRTEFPQSPDYRSLYATTRFVLENNTIVASDNTAIDFQIDYGNNHVIRNNLVAASPEAIDIGNHTNVTTETNASFQTLLDPVFVDASSDNFRLQAASSAVDAGSETEGSYVNHSDLDLNPRESGSSIDIGSYESIP